MDDLLPPNVSGWFRVRGWTPRDHQMAMVAAAREHDSALLIAPTGAGKTLAGFLPSLIELSERPREGLHTLYVSPLKALAVDVKRNLETPIAELRLPIRTETRTGDTPDAKRRRQRAHPPQILMTTPESLALLLSYPDAARIFAPLRCVVIDELHAMVDGKRGDLLALCLSRLARLAPAARRVGLSATVAEPSRLLAWLSRTGADDGSVRLVRGRAGAAAEVEILASERRIPWGGHMAWYAMPDVYARIRDHRTTLVFVNTRAQAELIFQALWLLNEDSLPIAIHHGSLSPEQRRKVEAAMARGDLRAVVATSSLDLGIDWAAIDLVVQVGAPKGASRLIQRIGRANHRLDEPSRALLVPGNRFEVLECKAAVDAVRALDLDAEPPRAGGLDVLAQHILGMACSAPFRPDDLYEEVISAAPYAGLPRDEFDDVLDFVATGGYALGAYERYQRLTTLEDGTVKAASAQVARQYRLNAGTIVAEPMMRVRLRNGPVLGEIEEYFVQGLTAGDTFVFGGQLLTFIGIREMDALCAKGGQGDPAVPVYAGGRFPLTTRLADRVRALLEDPEAWEDLPADVREWLTIQRWRSILPPRLGLLVETFPRGGKRYLIAYPFEGRNAHQTLGMLLTRRMERMGCGPLGFVATDYVIAVWSLRSPKNMNALFDEDMLGDDLEEWMDESSLMRRTFRNVAIISGVIERRHPGEEKTGRQVTVNSDLIYDVLRRHDPGHVLMRATRADAAGGLTDVARLGAFLKRIRGHIVTKDLDRISPLAVPAILAIGREAVYGSADDELLEAAAAEVVAEAMPELSMPPQQGRLI
jgi:ATP-dependent helicase Lhr and Lhr-like helicase